MRQYLVGNGTASPHIPRDFAALMDALQLKGANSDALLSLKEAEWRRLLDFCDLAHLTLPLSQVDLTSFPEWIVRRLEKAVSDNSKRFERISETYTEAAAALEADGVSHIVLKGFTLVPDYVVSPRLRVQSDLDIYCPQEQIEAAQAALVRIGYRSVDKQDCRRSDHIPALTRLGKWTWRGNMHDPEMPPSIELHFSLWNSDVSLVELPEANHFWERWETRRIGKLKFPALNLVDQLGYLSLHVVRDVISGDWIVNHVRELATFLHFRARDGEFWNRWLNTHSVRLRQIEAIAFCLARNWFSCNLAPVVHAGIEQLPHAHKAWLMRFSGSPLEGMFRRNKHGQLLQLLLADSSRARHVVVRRALIPARFEGPNAPAVRIRNRRVTKSSNANRYAAYLAFLVDRLLANTRANFSFLFHGGMLWLSERSLNSQFWTFLSASFFLTWDYRSTSSFLIFF